MSETYITALDVNDLFVDDTYQRELDTNRVVSMSKQWQPRLVGVIEVSDRGEACTPRYAVINGQHRWQAAALVDPRMSLPATVHTGLTVDEEARLFWDIDRTTKKLSNWDRWYARRASGDPVVVGIDALAAKFGYTVTHNPSQTNTLGRGRVSLQCCSALEVVVDSYDYRVLRLVLELIGDIWPGDPEARKSNIIKGLGRLFGEYEDQLDSGRLADALSALTPSQLVARAHELKARGSEGGIPKLTTMAALMAYNRVGGPKIDLKAA
ncbi:DUF6551 family protein [Gordonia alkaliphila]|uniref:Uncharacterized protein n=1 Tax=Gordonia alkaliphila TaxID=1053547 RepID=A0ABP8ZGX7_9ACTN